MALEVLVPFKRDDASFVIYEMLEVWVWQV